MVKKKGTNLNLQSCTPKQVSATRSLSGLQSQVLPSPKLLFGLFKLSGVCVCSYVQFYSDIQSFNHILILDMRGQRFIHDVWFYNAKSYLGEQLQVSFFLQCMCPSVYLVLSTCIISRVTPLPRGVITSKVTSLLSFPPLEPSYVSILKQPHS